MTIPVKKAKNGDGRIGQDSLVAMSPEGLKAFDAPAVDLAGDIHLLGPIGSITLGDVADGSTIQLDGPVGTLAAKSLGDCAVSAPSIGSLVGGGKLAASAAVSGDGVPAGKPTLRILRVSGPVLASADIDVVGLIGSVTTGSFHGTLTAWSAGPIRVKGDLTGDISLVQHWFSPFIPELKALTVTGVVDGSNIDVAGGVGRLVAGAFRNSTLFAGYSGTPNGLSPFDAEVAIGSFRVTAKTDGYENSNVVAAEIGTVRLRSVHADNGGTAFGFWAHSFGSLQAATRPMFKFKPGGPAVQGIGPDFDVRVV